MIRGLLFFAGCAVCIPLVERDLTRALHSFLDMLRTVDQGYAAFGLGVIAVLILGSSAHRVIRAEAARARAGRYRTSRGR